LIECIPNSISIDQLKRKSKIATLNEFYEKYYGPVNSESKLAYKIKLFIVFL